MWYGAHQLWATDGAVGVDEKADVVGCRLRGGSHRHPLRQVHSQRLELFKDRTALGPLGSALPRREPLPTAGQLTPTDLD